MATMPDDTADGALERVAQSVEMYVCSAGSITTRANAISNALNDAHTLTAGDGNGDWTIANGSLSGRKISISQQSITYDTTGSATQVAYCTASVLRYVQDLDATYAITSGETRTFDAGDVWEIGDPI